MKQTAYMRWYLIKRRHARLAEQQAEQEQENNDERQGN